MKQLLWKLVLPLSIISFTIFTKWWYVELIDGHDEIIFGFPLPYVCPGWHTSLSLQIFVLELLLDILVYFAFWLVLIFFINKYVLKIKMKKLITITLLSVAGILLAFMIWIASNSDNIYTLKRSFEIETKDTGWKFIWQEEPKPDK